MLQEEITKEFEERKIELEAKALEIYQASDADIKKELDALRKASLWFCGNRFCPSSAFYIEGDRRSSEGFPVVLWQSFLSLISIYVADSVKFMLLTLNEQSGSVNFDLL
ncbi:hypothetical protein ZIOFF_001537 [Zingiber officinale]|uniref:Uncharacterized protein n=1 Tax=Zingiber officinale TaxID=94328 RepID=A0A8J5IK75_ZINOF|nr:hypothetical protein ZIOFF_001537 [Zingiber officinale]